MTTTEPALEPLQRHRLALHDRPQRRSRPAGRNPLEPLQPRPHRPLRHLQLPVVPVVPVLPRQGRQGGTDDHPEARTGPDPVVV